MIFLQLREDLQRSSGKPLKLSENLPCSVTLLQIFLSINMEFSSSQYLPLYFQSLSDSTASCDSAVQN